MQNVGNQAAVAIGFRQADRKVILACGVWGLMTLLLFGLHAAFDILPIGFPIVVSLLKMGAFSLAAVLCWHNSTNPEILSGRSVWQAIAAGMICFVLGDATVMLWRSLWDIQSTVALANVFYGASYLFLAIGLFQAVLPRQMTLSVWQTLGIGIPGVLGIVIASWITFQTPTADITSELTRTGLASVEVISDGRRATKTVQNTSQENVSKGSDVPMIVQTVERRLGRVTKHFGLLYVAGDCVLIVLAAALLVTFWGGTYSEAWKLIAMAGLCLYVADMFLIYQQGQGAYAQGAVWELFWVLSALCFGLGAGVENGISTRMKERAPRRHWL